ncbi:MAG: lmo0937 family membrane protein [Candidatus Pacebacteria bacterium]|nr:lmo0937 family membrane protein [Candidatus Paceibacterota bacterium]
MLYTIGVVLIVLWLLGVVGVFVLGKFIHLLLLAALIMFLIRIIKGRNPVA